MNRRGFLRLIGIAAPAALLVPELIIPQRSIFLPPAGGWIASGGNVLLTSAYFTNEALRVLESSLRFSDWEMDALENLQSDGIAAIYPPGTVRVNAQWYFDDV